jgi:hypothetical protein
MRNTLLAILSAFMWSSWSPAQVRKVAIKIDDIVTVKTALGIATIIQLPETIQSAIIGDQSGFKVEYLDRAVTIKPLRSEVKTNLYLITEKQRYNVRLVTLAQASADYIVYFKSPGLMSLLSKWTKIEKSQQLDDVKFSIERVGLSERGFILIDARITTTSSQSLSLKPDDFEIKQGGRSKVINGLFLSDLKISKNKPILLGISLSKSDLISKKAITLEMKSRNNFSLTLDEGLLWK